MTYRARRILPGHKAVAPFVLAVTITAFLTSLALTVFQASYAYGGPDIIGTALMFLFGSLVAMPIIAAAGLVVGLPVTWILSRNGLEQSWTYPLLGFLSGAMIVLVLIRLLGAQEQREFIEALPITLLGAVPGAIYGALWWFLHRRHAARLPQ